VVAPFPKKEEGYEHPMIDPLEGYVYLVRVNDNRIVIGMVCSDAKILVMRFLLGLVYLHKCDLKQMMLLAVCERSIVRATE